MNTQIPENVALLISTKKHTLEEDKKQSDEQARIKRQTLIDVGREILQSRIKEILQELPEWLHPYDVTESHYDDELLVRTGEGYNTLTVMNLRFDIPGLAPIAFNSKNNTWRSAKAHWRSWNDSEKPDLSFGNDCYWRTNLEYVLVEAEEEAEQFVKQQRSYESHQEEIKKQIAERIDRDAEQERQLGEDVKIQKTEAEELFEIFNADPAAIALMKAFLMVRQERGIFEQLINEAYETIYSVEERLTRKAADLRRQAQDAEHQAEDERGRVSDLEDDLSKAKKQIKSQG